MNSTELHDTTRVKRQVFLPSNFGTNTFVFDSVSFLSLLTLVVFIVRVFNRVLQSNNIQTVSVAVDPSLGRAAGDNSRISRSIHPSSRESRSVLESEYQQVTSVPRFSESVRKRSIQSINSRLDQFS